MGLKEFSQIISDQFGNQDDTKLTELLSKLKGKPFWIWSIDQHRQAFKDSGGFCCFNHIIGLAQKNSQPKPMFDYEKLLFDALLNSPIPYTKANINPDAPIYTPEVIKQKHLWVKKATGLGITEFVLRFMTWLCVKDDTYSSSQMVLVTGPSIEIAITLVRRLKALFETHSIFFEFKETVLELNGVHIEAFPSHHLDTFRALERPSLIFLDEADFFAPSQQIDARHVSERYIAKSDPFIILVSTPNAPGELFDRIEQEDEKTCIYKRFKLDWTVGLGKIYTQADIDKARASPAIGREYDLQFLGKIGNSFRTQDILRAQSFEYNPDAITLGVDRVIGIDPAFGSSSCGITITSIIDDK